MEFSVQKTRSDKYMRKKINPLAQHVYSSRKTLCARFQRILDNHIIFPRPQSQRGELCNPLWQKGAKTEFWVKKWWIPEQKIISLAQLLYFSRETLCARLKPTLDFQAILFILYNDYLSLCLSIYLSIYQNIITLYTILVHVEGVSYQGVKAQGSGTRCRWILDTVMVQTMQWAT